jgi:hypothetical protein
MNEVEMDDKIKLAQKYCQQYGTELSPAWEGLKVIKHPWHQPARMIAYPMTYAEFIDRIIEIAEYKPVDERAERLALMKPYKTEFKLPKYLTKAGDAYNKVKDAYIKAGDAYNKVKDAYNKARDAYNKVKDAYIKARHPYIKARDACNRARDAYIKAVERWQKVNIQKIEKVHAKECPNCKWDGEKLPQFESK